MYYQDLNGKRENYIKAKVAFQNKSYDNAESLTKDVYEAAIKQLEFARNEYYEEYLKYYNNYKTPDDNLSDDDLIKKAEEETLTDFEMHSPKQARAYLVDAEEYSKKNKDMAKVAERKKIKPLKKDSNPLLALMSAITTNDEKTIAEVQKQDNFDINFQDNDGKSALHHAVERNLSKAAIERILQMEINPDLKDRDGNTALHIAAKLCNSQRFRVRDLAEEIYRLIPENTLKNNDGYKANIIRQDEVPAAKNVISKNAISKKKIIAIGLAGGMLAGAATGAALGWKVSGSISAFLAFSAVIPIVGPLLASGGIVGTMIAGVILGAVIGTIAGAIIAIKKHQKSLSSDLPKMSPNKADDKLFNNASTVRNTSNDIQSQRSLKTVVQADINEPRWKPIQPYSS